MANAILRLPAARSLAGLSRSTIYARIAGGTWPRPVRLGPRAVGWPASEIDALIRATIAGASDDELRRLVERLHSARASAADSIEVAP